MRPGDVMTYDYAICRFYMLACAVFAVLAGLFSTFGAAGFGGGRFEVLAASLGVFGFAFSGFFAAWAWGGQRLLRVAAFESAFVQFCLKFGFLLYFMGVIIDLANRAGYETGARGDLVILASVFVWGAGAFALFGIRRQAGAGAFALFSLAGFFIFALLFTFSNLNIFGVQSPISGVEAAFFSSAFMIFATVYAVSEGESEEGGKYANFALILLVLAALGVFAPHFGLSSRLSAIFPFFAGVLLVAELAPKSKNLIIKFELAAALFFALFSALFLLAAFGAGGTKTLTASEISNLNLEAAFYWSAPAFAGLLLFLMPRAGGRAVFSKDLARFCLYALSFGAASKLAQFGLVIFGAQSGYAGLIAASFTLLGLLALCFNLLKSLGEKKILREPAQTFE